MNINLFLGHINNNIDYFSLDGDEIVWYDLSVAGIRIFTKEQHLSIIPSKFVLYHRAYIPILGDLYIMTNSPEKYVRYTQLARFLYPNAHEKLWSTILKIPNAVGDYYHLIQLIPLSNYIQSVNN